MNRFLLTLTILLLTPVAIPATAFASEKYALLIGVTKYDHAAMNTGGLKFPEADAESVAKLLARSGYRVDLLLGNRASRTNIEASLNKLSKEGGADGAVLIGMFGHGVQYGEDGYFAPFDTVFRAVKDSQGKLLRDKNGQLVQEPDPESMVSMRAFLDAMSLSKASNKIMLADCCREDPNRARGRNAFGSNLTTKDLPEGTAALFACSRNEQAMEHDDWQHGAFTKAFLDQVVPIASQGDVKAGTLAERIHGNVRAMVQEKTRQIQNVTYINNGIVDLKIQFPKSLREDKSLVTDWLPTKTEYVLHVRVNDILKGEHVSGLISQNETYASFTQQMEDATGFRPDEVESVTIGVSNIAAVFVELGQIGQNPDPDTMKKFLEDDRFCFVVRTVNDINLQKYFDAGLLEQAVDSGKEYYVVPQSHGLASAVYLPDRRTLVFSSKTSIPKLISRGATGVADDALNSLPNQRDVAISMSSPYLAVLSGSIPDPVLDSDTPPADSIQGLVSSVRGNITGATGIYDFRSDLILEFRARLVSLDAASSAGESLKGILEFVRSNEEEIIGGVDALQQPFVTALLRGASISQVSNEVSVSFRVPKNVAIDFFRAASDVTPATE